MGQAPGQSAAQTGEQAAPQIQRPAIDLSWEPDLEPRVAGYRVYRRDLDGDAASVWQQLGSELMPMAAYRDLSVVAGSTIRLPRDGSERGWERVCAKRRGGGDGPGAVARYTRQRNC